LGYVTLHCAGLERVGATVPTTIVFMCSNLFVVLFYVPFVVMPCLSPLPLVDSFRYVLDGDREELRFIRSELATLRSGGGGSSGSSSSSGGGGGGGHSEAKASDTPDRHMPPASSSSSSKPTFATAPAPAPAAIPHLHEYPHLQHGAGTQEQESQQEQARRAAARVTELREEIKALLSTGMYCDGEEGSGGGGDTSGGGGGEADPVLVELRRSLAAAEHRFAQFHLLS
jgi:hypothetical protein